jgi:hypothetical protein
MTDNQIGLGLMIGEGVVEDAKQYAINVSSHHRRKKRGGVNFLVVMAKPFINASMSFTRTRTNTLHI